MPWLMRTLGCVLLCACAGSETLTWSIDASPEIQAEVTLVTAQIRAGGCDGEVLFSDTALPDQGMPTPRPLSAGTYGFAIEVSNDACEAFARGCTELEIPASTVTTSLESIAAEPRCAPNFCTDGVCGSEQDAMADAEPIDGAVPKAPGCVDGIDEWTAMLFDFEDLPGTTSMDNTRNFTASFFSENGMAVPRAATDTASAQGCGKGILGNETWGNVDHSAVFAQRESSIDLLYKTPTSYIPTRMIAILSKDADGLATTHLSLGVNPDGRIMVRMQPGGGEFFRCSKPFEPETWVHIGINFGAPNFELWVNGELANEAGTYAFLNSSQPDTCNTEVQAINIADNTEPWAIGAAAFLSTAGTNDMVRFEHDLGAVIDRVRFSTTRRDFSDPPLP